MQRVDSIALLFLPFSYSINSVVFSIFLRCQLRLSFNLFRLNVRSIGKEKQNKQTKKTNEISYVCVQNEDGTDDGNDGKRCRKRENPLIVFA